MPDNVTSFETVEFGVFYDWTLILCSICNRVYFDYSDREPRHSVAKSGQTSNFTKLSCFSYLSITFSFVK